MKQIDLDVDGKVTLEEYVRWLHGDDWNVDGVPVCAPVAAPTDNQFGRGGVYQVLRDGRGSWCSITSTIRKPWTGR